jgi:hypothetical protein
LRVLAEEATAAEATEELASAALAKRGQPVATRRRRRAAADTSISSAAGADSAEASDAEAEDEPLGDAATHHPASAERKRTRVA